MENVRIREATDKDLNFIMSSWLKSYEKSNFAQTIHKHIYYKKHEEKIKNILKKSQIYILCDAIEPSSIFSWICLEEYKEFNVLHYIYTRKTFKKFGLANALYNEFLKDKDLIYTHNTYIVQELYNKHKNDREHFIHKSIYNPYLFLC